MEQTAFFCLNRKSERARPEKKVIFLSLSLSPSSLSPLFSLYSSAATTAAPPLELALRALEARISAEALAAAARFRSGLSDAAALPADAATRLGEVFLETEVEVALEGLEAFLGRETRMATPAPPGAGFLGGWAGLGGWGGKGKKKMS